MRIVRTGERLTIAEQLLRNRAFRGRPLALDFRGPKGEQLRASEVFAAGAQGIAGVMTAAAARAAEIELPEMIDDPRLPFKVAKGVLPESSLSSGREAAAKMNAQEPGRKIRIPTEPELLKLNELLGDQLEGPNDPNDWIWTETEHEKYQGQYVLRHLADDYRFFDFPNNRYYGDRAVRFVEDR